MDAPKSPPARTLAYVDGIEEGTARLVLRDARGEWRSYDLPRSLLPTDAREGLWIELVTRLTTPPPEAEATAALRARLGRGDKGGDIAL